MASAHRRDGAPTPTRTHQHQHQHSTDADNTYREMMQRLQSEFSRVVATLEARNAALVQLNEQLNSEVHTLRTENADLHSELQRQQNDHEAAMGEAEQQHAVAIEEHTTRLQEAADAEHQLRATCEQLQLALESEQKQWETERNANADELARVANQLASASAQLADEQRANVTLSQELQLLQCRVDSVVKTSQAFEQRLQQLKQLKRDEKRDLEAHIAHLQKRLDDTKTQNRYLADALTQRDVVSTRKPSSTTSASPPKSSAPTPTPTPPPPPHVDRLRRKDAESSSTTKRRHEYRLDYKLEDLHSHAPTSPTSSSSPPSTPSSMTLRTTVKEDRYLRPTASSALHSVARKASAPTPTTRTTMATRTTTTASSAATRTSERLQRELFGLRRKLEACMHDSSDAAR